MQPNNSFIYQTIRRTCAARLYRKTDKVSTNKHSFPCHCSNSARPSIIRYRNSHGLPCVPVSQWLMARHLLQAETYWRRNKMTLHRYSDIYEICVQWFLSWYIILYISYKVPYFNNNFCGFCSSNSLPFPLSHNCRQCCSTIWQQRTFIGQCIMHCACACVLMYTYDTTVVKEIGCLLKGMLLYIDEIWNLGFNKIYG